MNEYWIDDLKKSAAVIKQATPILKNMLNDQNLTIKQVEGKDEEICQILDQTCGMDYLIVCKDGQTFGVAWRCQWVEPGKEYNSFTVRKTRDSGTPTEYEKRAKAIQHDALYPRYVVQAFVNQYTNEILSMAITTTKAQLEFIEKEDPPTRHTGKNQHGQAEFYVLWWVDMRLFGYDIVVYKAAEGIL